MRPYPSQICDRQLDMAMPHGAESRRRCCRCNGSLPVRLTASTAQSTHPCMHPLGGFWPRSRAQRLPTAARSWGAAPLERHLYLRTARSFAWIRLPVPTSERQD